MTMATERLSKFLAHSGTASRRKSEEIIRSGRVRVNGATVTDPAHPVDRAVDVVSLDNKPSGPLRRLAMSPCTNPRVICPTSPTSRARTVPSRGSSYGCEAPLFPVGRLDYNSEGLMIFTNDGAFANLVMHPRYEVEKEYHVKLSGALTQEELKAAVLGFPLDKGAGVPVQDDRAAQEGGEKHLVQGDRHGGQIPPHQESRRSALPRRAEAPSRAHRRHYAGRPQAWRMEAHRAARDQKVPPAAVAVTDRRPKGRPPVTRNCAARDDV